MSAVGRAATLNPEEQGAIASLGTMPQAGGAPASPPVAGTEPPAAPAGVDLSKLQDTTPVSDFAAAWARMMLPRLAAEDQVDATGSPNPYGP
jgi:hypothetical protein